jgi:hypothetical protein
MSCPLHSPKSYDKEEASVDMKCHDKEEDKTTTNVPANENEDQEDKKTHAPTITPGLACLIPCH